MKVICIGYNCGATFVAKETGCYVGCSPTDWTVCSPETSLILFSELFAGKDTTVIVDDYMKLDEKGNNNTYHVYAPHFLQSSQSENNLYYDPGRHTKCKMARRMNRIDTCLRDFSDTLVLLYVDDYKEIDTVPALNEKPLNTLIRLRELVSLFRPKETFRICYITPCKLQKQTEFLEDLGIDYVYVSPAPSERFWILPCVEAFKKKYGL